MTPSSSRLAAFITQLLTNILILSIFFVPLSETFAEDRRTDKSVLTIMTFNAEFLWDGKAPEEGSADFPWKFSQTEAEDHMEKIAQVIIQGNPDIINLVEVENLDALTTLNSKFLANRGYKPYFIQGNDNSTGQDVVLLTRIDPETIPIERDDRKGQSGSVKKSVSKNYFAKFTIGNTKLTLIGLHFLAQPNRDDRRLQREAQAQAIRNLAMEQVNSNSNVIVLGDFNDYDGSSDCLDHINSTPITNVLSIIKEMNSSNANDDLVNVASLLPKGIRYTAFWDQNENNKIEIPHEYTSIDHVLMSKELAGKIQTVDVLHAHDPREVSDHFPIVVKLRMDDAPLLSATSSISIIRLLPNPQGNENENEEITLKNSGNQDVNLNNWKLRDLSGKTWTLNSGVLKAGKELVVKRNNQAMALNNNGDTIDLIDNNGNVLQTITYGNTVEGEEIFPTSIAHN